MKELPKQPEGSSLHHQGKCQVPLTESSKNSSNGTRRHTTSWASLAPRRFFPDVFPCNYWVCLMVGAQEVGEIEMLNGNCVWLFVGTSLSKQMKWEQNPWPTLKGVDEHPGIYASKWFPNSLFIFRHLNFLRKLPRGCNSKLIEPSASALAHWKNIWLQSFDARPLALQPVVNH